VYFSESRLFNGLRPIQIRNFDPRLRLWAKCLKRLRSPYLHGKPRARSAGKCVIVEDGSEGFSFAQENVDLFGKAKASSRPNLTRPSTPPQLKNEFDAAQPADKPWRKLSVRAASLPPFRRVERVDGRATPGSQSGGGHDAFGTR
jgi:hypothetical protein